MDISSFSHRVVQKSQQKLLLNKFHVKSNIGIEQQLLRHEKIKKNTPFTTTTITIVVGKNSSNPVGI